MALHNILFLFFAGALSGVLNAVAGGGSFVAFPALLFSGVAPITANATSTVALWVGLTASTRSYRKHLDISRRVMIPLAAASLIGGVCGAYLLLHTPAWTFLRALPWLMLMATLLFAFGGRLSRGSKSAIAHDASTFALTVAVMFELAVAVYGGYFGGGIGILIFAMLAALGMTDIHAMNALRIALAAVINSCAVITFILAGAVAWRPGGVMLIGALLGGHFGGHYAQKLPPAAVRAFVIVVGTAMTLYFFWKAYL